MLEFPDPNYSKHNFLKRKDIKSTEITKEQI